jgi:hypothetical protein
MMVDSGWCDFDHRRQNCWRTGAGDGLGGPSEAEDGPGEAATYDGGKSELLHCGAFFFLSCVMFEPWQASRGSDAVSAGSLSFRAGLIL